MKPGAAVDPIIAASASSKPDSLAADRDRGAPQGGERARRQGRLRQLGHVTARPPRRIARSTPRPRAASRMRAARAVLGWPPRRPPSRSRPRCRSSRSSAIAAGGSGDALAAPRRPTCCRRDAATPRSFSSASACSSSRSAPAPPGWSRPIDFPGRRILDWALLLPLAVPTYIVAYAYLDLLHPIGPVQTLHPRHPRHRRAARSPPARHPLDPGRVLLLGFVLYPYVYLPTRALFLMQAAGLVEVARTLGAGRARGLLPGRAAARAPGDRGRREPRADGGAERRRRLGIPRRAHADASRSTRPGSTGRTSPARRRSRWSCWPSSWCWSWSSGRPRRGQRFGTTAQRTAPPARRPLRGLPAAAALAAGLVPVADRLRLPGALPRQPGVDPARLRRLLRAADRRGGQHGRASRRSRRLIVIVLGLVRRLCRRGPRTAASAAGSCAPRASAMRFPARCWRSACSRRSPASTISSTA